METLDPDLSGVDALGVSRSEFVRSPRQEVVQRLAEEGNSGPP